MKAIYMTENGGPEVLKMAERPDLQADDGQLLIDVRASGINFADLMARQGTYRLAPKPPMTPGLEVAGTVANVGANVEGFAVGDRVMSLLQTGGGGYAEQAVVEAQTAVKLPDELDFAPATALLVQGLTAYFLLKTAPLAKGESVLVNAAAGGVGSLAVQIAKLMGAGTVIGTASTPEKRQMVEDLGADVAVDYTQSGWAEKVKAETNGRGVDVFLDATGELDGEGFETLAEGARWMIYGAQSGNFGSLRGERAGLMLAKSLTLRGYTLYHTMTDAARIVAALQELIGWTTSGQLKIDSGHRFPLSQAAQAHEAIAARKTTGKVVLEP
jgi:NADPH2:quinone reductase